MCAEYQLNVEVSRVVNMGYHSIDISVFPGINRRVVQQGLPAQCQWRIKPVLKKKEKKKKAVFNSIEFFQTIASALILYLATSMKTRYSLTEMDTSLDWSMGDFLRSTSIESLS